MKKFVMYTARFGTPGRVRVHANSMPEVDKIFFTDVDIEEGCHQIMPTEKGKTIKNDFYNVKKMNLSRQIPMGIKRQRFVKICIPDEIFNNYEYSVYVDCKRPVFVDFEWMLSFLKPDSDIVLRQHPARNCAYDEANFLIRKERYDNGSIRKQVDYYKKASFPVNYGLYSSFQIFRRHTKQLKECMHFWWKQVEEFSYRDQISLPYVDWIYPMNISIIPRRRKR